MVSTLPNLLPSIVIASCAWFQAEHDRLKAAGVLVPLSKAERIQARAVGVAFPERVRIARLLALPTPTQPELTAAAAAFGMFSPAMTAFAAGYLVLLRTPGDTPSLLAHELRLVHHFERLGSLDAYVKQYLVEVLEHGYGRTPMELDAERAAAGLLY